MEGQGFPVAGPSRQEKNAWTRESVDILKRAGVDFGKQKKEGIDIRRFANLFVQSPLFRSLRITWITFHGGYDVLYLLKMVGPGLQYDKRVFNEVVSHYFPIILDVKYLSAWVWGPEATRKGLQRIADILQVPRIGKQHQAGSDSHLTGQVFFVILYTLLYGIVDIGLLGKVYPVWTAR
ncbi:poly(A) ribonuclease pop2-like [Homalodisca vitripennis]|uniref:poly(A) ribonuclease pop2-like n=1 Tax=Homalodisca vitripennis TaxID=197043 RepID=UPI001EEB361E|nr:poly(A) ribonuclease pop2-like [Homalodisca vitripennis]